MYVYVSVLVCICVSLYVPYYLHIRPIPVYGYNDAWPIAGDIFEAETNCNSAHNMGQIASDGVNNLSYLDRHPPITTTAPLEQNPSVLEEYNASKTYVMFVMGKHFYYYTIPPHYPIQCVYDDVYMVLGDGDNVHFLETSRRQWMQQRVDNCEKDPSYMGCVYYYAMMYQAYILR